MRRMFFVVLLFLIPFGSMAQDSPMNSDGRTWELWGKLGSASLPVKAAYVQGALAGLHTGAFIGYSSGRLDGESAALEHLKPCVKGPCAGIPPAMLITPLTTDEIKAGADKVEDGFTPQHASVLDIVRQMDKFYADYRNTPVCMITAVQESINSLRGTASSEQGLEMERKGCNP